MDHNFIDVNGQRLHVVTQGAGSTLLLFVHGFPEFWYAWRAQLEAFGHDHLAAALDMRGFNLSSKPASVRHYRAKHLVEDLRQVIVHFSAKHGSQRIVLIAHDWGGAVAWNFAAQHPELLERLVIINAPHPVTFVRELMRNPEQQRASHYMNLFRSDKAERVMAADDYRRLYAMTLGEWGRRVAVTEEDKRAYLDAWAQPGALTGGLNYYRASPMHPPSTDDPAPLPELDANTFFVTVPTLVIWGEEDQALLTANLDGLERHVANLRIVRVPDASHWIVHERPALVNALIRNFIEEKNEPWQN
jgi:pimeloyl-ACP methyl ester carboxylesterase